MSAHLHSIVFPAILASCVAYEPDNADPKTVAVELGARSGGTFTVDEAIALALRQNPDLAALEARARAAQAATTVPLPLVGEFRGRADAWGVMIDPVALLGLGPRGATIDTASAKSQAAVVDLAVARWRTLSAVAEAFLVDAALGGLIVADVAIDTSAFERAGLASRVAAARLRAAQAAAKSERIALERDRADNLTSLRRLLGLPRTAALKLAPIPEDWFRAPAGNPGELLQRPDLRLSAARFVVADAEFRQAVADQYPTLQIGPNFSLSSDPLRAMAMIHLPIGAHRLAEAARERRQAARHDLEGAFLTAQEEAALADENLRAADAVNVATDAALRASITAFTAARAGIDVEPDAFAPFAETAHAVIRDTRARRRAVTDFARARIERARAYGWPGAEEEEKEEAPKR